MKRIVLITCITFLVGFNCKAASDNDSTRYLASTMTQNWFITADASVNWWQGSDRNPNGNYTSLNGPTFGGGVSLGKWITHKLALRLAYDVNRSHSYINGLHSSADNFQFLYDNNPVPDDNGYCTTTFFYHNLHGDVLISPIDLYMGYYNPKRLYTPVLFMGMGLACVSGHASMIKSITEKKWNFEFSADIGLMNQFRLNNYLDLSLTFIWTAQEWHIDSWYNEFGFAGNPRPRIADFNYTASLGISWYPLGRIYELPYNYLKEMQELRERLKDCEMSLEGTSEQQNPVEGFQQAPDTAFIITPGELVTYPLSIFFHRDSYELMSGRDLVNLREIAKAAMDHNCKIKLRGSCDSATATVPYNQRLSENRCHKIQQELMKLGVPEDRITFDAIGGIKELDPTKYDRRVIITLIKE